MAREHRHLKSCHSTNDVAKTWALAGARHGDWLTCDAQDAGRGRMGRIWEGTPGGLFLSMVLRPEGSEFVTWLPLAVAVGVSRGLRELFPALPLRIKWPNDLWVGGKKLGGILCEASGTVTGSFVIAGLGLNCVSIPSGPLLRSAISLAESVGRIVLASEIRETIALSILESIDSLARGPAEVSRYYRDHALFPEGSEVEWNEGHARGTVLGLGSQGELRVASNGQAVSLFAEDVRVRPVRSTSD